MYAPDQAYRRVHLFIDQDDQHFQWGEVFAALDADAAPLSVRCFNVSFQVPHLAAFDPSSHGQFLPIRSFDATLSIDPERLQQIHAAHCAYSGHPGVTATVRALIACGHEWQGMTAQIAQFIRRCPTCCASRLRLHKVPVSASTLRLYARLLKRWHIDQTGPLPHCAHTGFSRFIVFTCEATQFVYLVGSRFGIALEIVIALVTVMSLFGLAEYLHSDHGKETTTTSGGSFSSLLALSTLLAFRTFHPRMTLLSANSAYPSNSYELCARTSVDITHGAFSCLLPRKA